MPNINYLRISIMVASKYLLVLLAIFLPNLLFAQQDIDANAKQIAVRKFIVLLEQIKDVVTRNQDSVYLGTEQVKVQQNNDLILSYTNQLIHALNAYEESSSKNRIPELHWVPATYLNLPKNSLVNVGEPGKQIINICRAKFIGLPIEEQALYPGQLTPGGCRISYGGYAFIVTEFDVLVGNKERLNWISMTDVKKHNPSQSNKNENYNTVFPASNTTITQMNDAVRAYNALKKLRESMNSQTFNFDIGINGALPVAGGYQGGNPVLICRANQKNTFTLGKLVLFTGSNGKTQEACDIGEDSKEVVIQNNYELLFWKP